MKRPYIPLGCTQQGRTVPTLLARARSWWDTHVIADDPADVLPWEAAPPPEHRMRPGWEMEDIDPGHPWPVYAVVLVAVLAVLALAGCGGGGDDEPEMSAQPVDCKARPELCQ